MRRVAGLVLTSTAILSACGTGSGTELKQAAVAPIEIQLHPEPQENLMAVRIDGFDVCTSGDRLVRVVGATFARSSGLQVAGFSRSFEPQQDTGAGYMTELMTRARSTETSPTDWFAQTCEAGKSSGTTTIKIDATWTTLPVQTDGLTLSYQVSDDKLDTKTVTIPVDFSVCDPQTGCPPDPREDE